MSPVAAHVSYGLYSIASLVQLQDTTRYDTRDLLLSRALTSLPWGLRGKQPVHGIDGVCRVEWFGDQPCIA
jgi:hypothetical protein